MNRAKMINTTQFQKKALEMVREVEGNGEEFIIIRNSRPAAVLLGYESYTRLKDIVEEKR